MPTAIEFGFPWNNKVIVLISFSFEGCFIWNIENWNQTWPTLQHFIFRGFQKYICQFSKGGFLRMRPQLNREMGKRHWIFQNVANIGADTKQTWASQIRDLKRMIEWSLRHIDYWILCPAGVACFRYQFWQVLKFCKLILVFGVLVMCSGMLEKLVKFCHLTLCFDLVILSSKIL